MRNVFIFFLSSLCTHSNEVVFERQECWRQQPPLPIWEMYYLVVVDFMIRDDVTPDSNASAMFFAA